MKAEIREEQQLIFAFDRTETFTEQLMEEVVEYNNWEMAIKKVRGNKGSPGIDGMTTRELETWMEAHGAELKEALLEGRYHPQPIKCVEIPKPDGGVRQLGIPAVIDRTVQQAILQVLDPILDPMFSKHSYGFRKGRSAHDALRSASKFVSGGRHIVVDIDLEKFFDWVNHDILMGKLGRRIRDKRLLKTIGRYLRSGIMIEGVCVPREEGASQGGPFSPLLSNFLLDNLDKELEKRGHCFCRYADDCNIYVKTEEAGKRVMTSITNFLEKELKLKVNREKSCMDKTIQRKFLGYTLFGNGYLTISKRTIKRFEEKIRNLTPRKIAKPIKEITEVINKYTQGWIRYFFLTEGRAELERPDGWIRRRLRAIKLRQLKRSRIIAKFLEQNGAS
jgi:RNA-directed DNA polymerase